ncbi:MAG: hypothetical protein GKR90_16345 [Pseudomonadales bacterium]|nr:hypothetical protein [Pseudomonadales bacterium]
MNRLFLLFFCLLPSLAWTESYDTESRVVAFGDVHGAYASLIELLQGTQIIDQAGHWRAGKTHLVSVGDLLDRGPESKAVMDLLMRLQNEAVAAGGRVHVLVGNHELMNLGRDLRDVSAEELAAVGGREGHRQAFSETGIYGKWLRTLPVVVRINDTLFSHGGFSSQSLKPLNELNREFWQAFGRVEFEGDRLQKSGLLSPDQSLLDASAYQEALPETHIAWQKATAASELGPQSLVWYRGNTACHPLLEMNSVATILSYHGVGRLVVGHTPTSSREIEGYLDNQVFAIDTGMLASVYRGQPRALEIRTESGETVLSVLKPTGEVIPPIGREGRRARAHAELQSEYEFIEMSKKAAKKARAAFLLSEHLDMNMVLPTKVVDKGIHRVKARLLSERTRQEKNLYRPNHCETGSDFDLLAVFDSLIGKVDRTLDNLTYDRRDWRIRALENANAFPTSSKLPVYSKPPRLAAAGFRNDLLELSETNLAELLGDLLTTKEIKAILKRRDKILQWASNE